MAELEVYNGNAKEAQEHTRSFVERVEAAKKRDERAIEQDLSSTARQLRDIVTIFAAADREMAEAATECVKILEHRIVKAKECTV